MTVNPVFMRALNSTSLDGNKAMLTEWKVTLSDQTQKIYFVLVFQKTTQRSLSSSSSASSEQSVYIGDEILEEDDLFETATNTVTERKIFFDSSGSAICAYDENSYKKLGYAITEAEFEKVNKISEKLIRQLGNFLITQLEGVSSSSLESMTAAANSSSSSSASSYTHELEDVNFSSEDMAAAASSSSSSAAPSGSTPTPESSSTPLPKDLARSNFRSRVASIVTCNRVAFILALIPPIFAHFYLNSNSDNQDLSEITSGL